MHLIDPYVPKTASYLGMVTLTVDDYDGTEQESPSDDHLAGHSGVSVRAEIRLISADGYQVATRKGDPHYMPEDWQNRAIALVQELRVATAEIQELEAAPPPDPEE